MIGPNVIIIWPKTNATIPAGFSRETRLDDKYPKGTADGVAPNVSGGNSTHQHAAAASHAHTMASHGHLLTLAHISGDGSDSDSGGSELTDAHDHHPTIYGVSGGGLSSVSATYDAVSNDPPYVKVIFIKANSWAPIPAEAVVLHKTTTIPAGFQQSDGTNSTVDFRNKYMKGAATGADAGTTGGSTTNVHTLSHTHTESAHTHAQWIYEAGDVDGGGRRGSGTGGRARLVHHHYVSLNASSAGITSSTPSLTTTETVEPAYKKLLAIANTAGIAKLAQFGMIGMWLGALADIPYPWRLCDGNNDTIDMRDKFLKIANTSGEIGNTGGSNTHTHASQNHTHSGGSHVHTSSTTEDNMRHNQGGDSGANGVGGGWGVMNTDHSHQGGGGVTNIQYASASWDAAATPADSQDNQPPFLTVAFVMYTYPMGGLIDL